MSKFLAKPMVKRCGAVFMVVCVMALMCVTAFATSTPADEAVSAASTAFSTLTDTISISNIMRALAIALAAAVGFFFFWWAVRKVVRMVTAAFKKGKISA